LKSGKANGQQEKKTYVLLDCERGGKYMKNKINLEVTVIGTRKCDCSFKLQGKLGIGEGWMLKVIYP